ncbi:MAG: hypothetical protein V7K71_32930 [Nostoc sp.]
MTSELGRGTELAMPTVVTERSRSAGFANAIPALSSGLGMEKNN